MEDPEPQTSQVLRRRDFDLLGSAVVLGLFPYHAALAVSALDYAVKGQVPSLPVGVLLLLTPLWGMPQMFLLAGMTAWHSLQRRSGIQFVGERVRRLVVPLITGLFLLMPVQAYVQLNVDPEYQTGFAEFYRRLFQVRLGLDFPMFLVGTSSPESFRLGHLYFLDYLFVYSVVLLPIFVYLRSRSRLDDSQVADLGPARLVAIFVPGLVVGIVEAALGSEALGAWNRYSYLIFLLAGYVLLASDGRWQAAARRHRKVVLGATLAAVLVYLLGWLSLVSSVVPGTDRGLPSLLLRTVKGLAGWSLVLAITGWVQGRRSARPTPAPADKPMGPDSPASGRGQRETGWRNENSWDRLAAYLTEARLPFYMLHMTPINVIAFHVGRWPLGYLARSFIVLCATLTVTVVVYEFGVRRWALTRFLFGMKARPR